MSFTHIRRNLLKISIFWVCFLGVITLISVANKMLVAGNNELRLLDCIVGLFYQLPFIFAVILIHFVLDILTSWLPRVLAMVISFVISSSMIFISLGFVLAAESNYRSFSVYLTFDVFRIFFHDLRQLLLSIWHYNLKEFIILVLASQAMGILFIFLPMTMERASRRFSAILSGMRAMAFSVLCIAIIGGVISIVSTYGSVRADTFPISFATFAMFNNLQEQKEYNNISLAGNLDRIYTMDEYQQDNGFPLKRPNVFILVLEAISSDHTGFNGYFRKDITPHIDALAKDSLTFINAYAPSNHSNYAQTGIHASQYARRQAYLDMFFSVDYPKTLLFDILAHYGYETAFISSQNERWGGMHRFIFAQGAQIDYFFHSPDELGKNIKASMKLDDAFTRSVAERYIDQRKEDRPLFLYMNLQKTHFPYTLPEGAMQYYSPTKVDFQWSFFGYPRDKVDVVRNRYDNALRYVDEQVGRFVAFLKSRGMYDDAIIILAPDHGEAFYKKGYPTHGSSLFDDQVKTFLMVKMPQNTLTGIRKDAVSLIDINPTVLELLGLGNHNNFQGEQVIRGNPENRYIFMTAQGVIPVEGVVQYPWKYIIAKVVGIKRLVNVEIDPSEQKDFSDAYPDKRMELEGALGTYVISQMKYYCSSPLKSTCYPPKY